MVILGQCENCEAPVAEDWADEFELYGVCPDCFDGEAPLDESDGFIDLAARRGFPLSVDGKHVGTFASERRARAAMSVYARSHGFYPSLWAVSVHGDLQRIDYW